MATAIHNFDDVRDARDVTIAMRLSCNFVNVYTTSCKQLNVYTNSNKQMFFFQLYDNSIIVNLGQQPPVTSVWQPLIKFIHPIVA